MNGSEEEGSQGEEGGSLVGVFSRLLAVLVKPAYAAVSWTLTPGSPLVLGTGTYTVFHSNHPGYTVTVSGDCSAVGIVTLGAGEKKTCTFHFEEKGGGGGGSSPSGLLTVVTIVQNDSGTGTSDPSYALMTVTTAGPTSVFGGIATPGINLGIPPGAYATASPDLAGYARSETSTCSGVMPNGGSIVCVVTYDDIPVSSPVPPSDPAPTPDADPAPAPAPAPTPAPTPIVLGATDTDEALPRTGNGPLAVVVPAILAACAAFLAVRRKV